MITYLMIKWLAEENADEEMFSEAIVLLFTVLGFLLDILTIFIQPILIIIYRSYKRALKKEKEKNEGYY